MKIEENMKKTLSLVLFLAFLSYQSQYLIIGKDSISEKTVFLQKNLKQKINMV